MDTAASASQDSAAPISDTTPDSTSARTTPPPGRDTVSNPTRVQVTQPVRPAPKPAPKPAAPKPAPATLERPDSAAATADTPADTTQAAAAPAAAQPADASAPLRDQYHQAPRDTVTAEVYEGWKQFNLNCARCHGEDVLGTTIAPHLIVSVRPDGAMATKEAFIQTVCAGRPEKGMPAWCPLGLEMDKINAIYLYVKGRSEGNIGPGRPARMQ